MGIMAVIGLIFDMRGRDRNSSLSLFGSPVNGTVLEEIGHALRCLAFGDGCRQGCLHSWLLERDTISVNGPTQSIPFRDQHDQWYLGPKLDMTISIGGIPSTLTNIDMRLVSLEGCCHASNGGRVADEDMVDRIDASRPQQRSPACAKKDIEGSEARHSEIPSTKRRRLTERWMGSGWSFFTPCSTRRDKRFSGQRA